MAVSLPEMTTSMRSMLRNADSKRVLGSRLEDVPDRHKPVIAPGMLKAGDRFDCWVEGVERHISPAISPP